MSESNCARLDLRAPLYYIRNSGLRLFPFDQSVDTPCSTDCNGETVEQLFGRELLFCFELDPEQSRRIDPDPERFFGQRIFSGSETVSACQCARNSRNAETVQLPAGMYLFSQRREALGRDACVDMAIEQQKDGLWERYVPQNRLYVRYLFEDGKPVTQVFRPVDSSSG